MTDTISRFNLDELERLRAEVRGAEVAQWFTTLDVMQSEAGGWAEDKEALRDLRDLIDRLASALTTARAGALEEAAHTLTLLLPTGSVPQKGVAREAWLAGHTSALLNAQGAIRNLKDPTQGEGRG